MVSSAPDNAPLVAAIRAGIPWIVDPCMRPLTPHDFVLAVTLGGTALSAALLAIEGKPVFADAERRIRIALAALNPLREVIDGINRT